MGSEREELETYLETVSEQVQRRAELVRKIQDELSILEAELKESKRGWKFDVRAMQMQQGFAEALVKKITVKKTELNQAREDMERAQEREASVRAELEELGEE